MTRRQRSSTRSAEDGPHLGVFVSSAGPESSPPLELNEGAISSGSTLVGENDRESTVEEQTAYQSPSS